MLQALPATPFRLIRIPFVQSIVSEKEQHEMERDGSKRPAFLKPLIWAYSAVGVVTVISIVVPIIWERIAGRTGSK